MKSLIISLILLCTCSMSVYTQHNVRLYDLLNELKYATQDTSKADILISLAKEYVTFDATKAIGKAELSLMIATNLNDDNRLFESLIILINAHYQQQNLNIASKYLSQAQQLKKVCANPIQKGKLLGIEGKVFLALEEYEKAESAFQQQLKIYETDGKWANSAEISDSYFEIGELNYIRQNYPEATGYFLKSLTIRKALNETQSIIEALNALGKTCLRMNNFQKGLDYCNEALFLTDPMSENKLQADIYLNLATALDQLNKPTEAIDKLEKAQIIAENRNNFIVLSKVMLKKGNILEKAQQRDLALSQYLRALQYAQNSKSKALIKDNFEVLYHFYERNGDTNNAFAYLKNLVSIRDSLSSEEQSKQYIINKIRFETEKKEQENQRLIARQLENEVTIQRQRTSNYILLALLLAGSIAGYALYQNLKRKKAYNILLEKEVQKRTELLSISNEELVNSNTLLEQSNAELERFAYIASHDLKSPLRNIISFMNLIERKLRGTEDKDLKEYLRFVTENALQMNILIQDVLEFSRIDTDNSSVKKEKIDLNETLTLAVQNLHESLKENNAEVIAGKLPTIRANSVHLLQLLQNMIANGIKYNQKEKRTVIITHKEQGNQHLITIKDNGIGIDKQYHEQIFEMFNRLHTRDEYKGTGIGLAICKKIVQNIGGKIWLESEPGHGSSFFISLPMEEKPHMAIV